MTNFKVPKQPFFKPGSLVFYGSGHHLIKDGEYYRCAKNSNQLCMTHSRRMKAETIERKFSRLAKSLHGKQLDPDELIEKLMRQNLCDMLFGIEDKVKGNAEITDATIRVVNQEISQGKKMKRADEKDFAESFMKTLRADHSVMLFGYAISMMRYFAVEDVPETEAGRALAHYSKKVYITDKAEIESIELERWAWYCFNKVIEQNWPRFFEEHKRVRFRNSPDELHKKNIVEAALSFGDEDFPEAMGENFLNPILMMKMMKDFLTVSLKGDMNKVNKNMAELMNQYNNNPILGILMRMTTLVDIKQK